MSDAAKTHRVLVKTGERQDGCATITEYEYIEVSEAQAAAYVNGDPAWREAKTSSWTSRLWRRLF